MATQSKKLFSSNSKIQAVSVLEGEWRVSYSSWWKIFFFVLSMCIPKRLIRLYSNLIGLFDDQRKYPFVFISVLDLALWKLHKHPLHIFFKICVLNILSKFTGKYPCWSLFSNKFTKLHPATSLKKELWLNFQSHLFL